MAPNEWRPVTQRSSPREPTCAPRPGEGESTTALQSPPQQLPSHSSRIASCAPLLHRGVPEPGTRETRIQPSSSAPIIRLVGEREHRLYVFEPEKVDYIESDGNYVKLHLGSAEYINRDSVKRLTRLLAAAGFVRIERSLLINVRAISYAQRVGRGRYLFTLISGSRLQSGSKYRGEILRALPFAQTPGKRSEP